MSEPIERALAHVARRMRVLHFVSGTVNALALSAIALGGTLLTLRLLYGIQPQPTPSWLWFLLPAALYGFARARRHTPDRRTCAVHLDRSLGLEGLLLTCVERDAGKWSAMLTNRLRNVSEHLPSLDGWALASRLAPAAAVLAVVLALPPALLAGQRLDAAAFGSAVADLESRIEELARENRLDATTEQEVRERLGELTEAWREGGDPRWSDLDQIHERLAHGESIRRDTMEQLASALVRMGQGGGGKAGAGQAAGELGERLAQGLAQGMSEDAVRRALADPRALDQLMQALEAAQRAGLVDEQALPEAARRRLRRRLRRLKEQKPGEGFSPQQLEQEIRRLQQLARMVEGKLTAEQRRRLQSLAPRSRYHQLTSQCRDGKCSSCSAASSTPSIIIPGPGRNGVNRGPGTAGLGEGNTEGGAQGQPLELPRPGAESRESELLGAERTENEEEAERDRTAGREGVADRGATANRQRALAPHHREAVRRFFAGEPEGARPDKPDTGQ
ncbi:MAG: hypothetical protein ACYTFT_00490 [Planctomycetota bacterium]